MKNLMDMEVAEAKTRFWRLLTDCYSMTDPGGEAEAMMGEAQSAAVEEKWAKAWEYMATASQMDPYAVDDRLVTKARHLSRFIRLGGMEVI